jgi:macrolide-specific efflux system membrane fusion protein
MNKKKLKFFLIVLAVLGITAFIIIKARLRTDSVEIAKEINPVLGSIQSIISTTGTVLPKNRLEIKPPVPGRIESILVREGDKVKTGKVLAWMSSTERAALLDAAMGQGEEKLKYWQEAYKPIALLAPINAEVIVATIQPGQTVTTADAVVVLSDQLIVRAQVDETDIGKIKLEQNALVSLDAYPDTKIRAHVEHIYFESKTVNNVTIYEVDLDCAEIPPILRSGMNASIDFIVDSKENALLVPLEAVHKERDESFVLVEKNGDKEPVRQVVKLGICDDKNAQVLSGLGAEDKIILKTKKFILPPVSNTGSNPFMPFGKKKEPARK